MRTASVGTRRFYDAFYRWSLLGETSHPCTRVLSTSRRYAAHDARTGKLPLSKARHVKINDERTGVGSLASQRNGGSTQLPSIYDQAVRSVTNLPFSAMEPWEEVVRHKSAAGFSVEMCIPHDVVTQVEREKGSLHSLVDVQDLRVDLGHPTFRQIPYGQSISLRSVLVTGSAEDIDKVRTKLLRIRNSSNTTTSEHINTKTDGIEYGVQRPEHEHRKFAKNNEDVEEQRQHTEDQDARSNFPPGNSPTGVGQTEEGLMSPEHYVLQLEWPLKLSSDEQENIFSWPEGISKLIKEIGNRTQCTIMVDSTILRFTGPQSGILEAKRDLLALLDEVCDAQGLSRREPHEVIALMKQHDANSLLKQQQFQAKLDEFKEALRPLTHPVALITASLPAESQKKTIDHFRGVTVSSFTSVSMRSPDPLVSFNLKLPSRTWDAMEDNPMIGIHLLDASPEGAAVAHAFTQPHDDPSEAFREVQRLGYEMMPAARVAHRLTHTKVKDGRHSGINSDLIANVLYDKCVHAGDHVIVVAALKYVMTSKTSRAKAAAGELFGLAYANRDYRIAGHAIKPAPIPEEYPIPSKTLLKEVDVSEDVEDGQVAEERETATFPRRAEINETALNTSNPLQSTTSRPSSTQPTSKPLPSFLQGWYRRYNTSSRGSAAQAARGQIMTTTEQDQSHAKIANKPVAATAAGNSFGSHEQEYYHNSSTNAETPALNRTNTSTINKNNAVQIGVADESLLSTTIGDFLNSHDDDPYVPRRMRALMKAKKQAYMASKRLQRNLETGTMTSDEVYQLERTVMLNERWIAKRLAFNSAYDLRLMLDKGKIDFRRAQWLESSIEKGQAVLLAELQQVREVVQKGKMSDDKYQAVKESLETDHQTLATEAMRLRQIVEEEGYDGASASEKKGFDGFSGNV